VIELSFIANNDSPPFWNSAANGAEMAGTDDDCYLIKDRIVSDDLQLESTKGVVIAFDFKADQLSVDNCDIGPT